MTDRPAESVRLDKWLWVARFFKTRALASTAIDGGKVQLNGKRVKRSHAVHPGDRLRVRKGPYEYRLTVTAVSERRLGPTEAAALYEEDPAGQAARKALVEQHRLAARAGGIEAPPGRPSKRDRRKLSELKRER